MYKSLVVLSVLAASSNAQLFSNTTTKSSNPTEQIECYVLPYGGIGFSTHILTYYTIILLTLGRSPWRFTPLKHSKWDLAFALIGFPLTVVPIIVTMVRCHSRWIFYLLAAWKLSLCLAMTGTSITTAMCVKRGVKVIDYHRERYEMVAGGGRYEGYSDVGGYQGSFWRTLCLMLLYGMGTVAGFIGLMVLVKEAWQEVPLLRHLTIGAGVLFGILAALGFGLGACCWPESWVGSGIGTAILVSIVIFGAGAVIYSDWALAAIAHNLVGAPDGNNWRISAVYWMYFAAKRLPMLSC